MLALTDESGTIVAEYTYDAWGNILTQKDLDQKDDINLAKENSYRYDEETKLYYLIARYYNPDTGVFMSLDPVRGDTMNPITMNGYSYANNNPVMMVDPDGEHPLLALVYQLIAPILITFAKRYGQKIMNKHVKNLLVKRIQPIVSTSH